MINGAQQYLQDLLSRWGGARDVTRYKAPHAHIGTPRKPHYPRKEEREVQERRYREGFKMPQHEKYLNRAEKERRLQAELRGL